MTSMDETEDIKPVGIVTFDLDEAEALLDDVAFVREYVERQVALEKKIRDGILALLAITGVVLLLSRVLGVE